MLANRTSGYAVLLALLPNLLIEPGCSSTSGAPSATTTSDGSGGSAAPRGERDAAPTTSEEASSSQGEGGADASNNRGDSGSGILAGTPPMGWNSWNRFQGETNDLLIRQTADAMVSSGMAAAGYQYVVVDEGWAGSRDATGKIIADPTAFRT